MAYAKRPLSQIIALYVTACILLVYATGAGQVKRGYAAPMYTDVLADLSADPSFDTAYYPELPDDYSVKVLQIAESVDAELILYAYQPSGKTKDYRASSINLSTKINDDIEPINYPLRFINASGTLYKYVVDGFTVSDEPTRYYTVFSIFRPFDEAADEPSDSDNTITYVSFPVEKQYTFAEINGKPYVSVVDIETITVTDKWVGFVRYPDGFTFFPSACDNHFVAFKTDKPIDKLLEADVYFVKQSYDESWIAFGGTTTKYGEKIADRVTLTGKHINHEGYGLWAGTYEWDEIETVDQFIAGVEKNVVYSHGIFDVSYGSELTEEAKKELQGMEWVLRFTCTDYLFVSGSGTYSKGSTIVGDVTILRLKFVTDGVTYNLGVIDNMQSGSGEPVNKTETTVRLNSRGWLLFAGVLLLLLAIFAFPVFEVLLKALWWIVCLPFKAIAAIVKAVKKRKAGKAETQGEAADAKRDGTSGERNG